MLRAALCSRPARGQRGPVGVAGGGAPTSRDEGWLYPLKDLSMALDVCSRFCEFLCAYTLNVKDASESWGVYKAETLVWVHYYATRPREVLWNTQYLS